MTLRNTQNTDAKGAEEQFLQVTGEGMAAEEPEWVLAWGICTATAALLLEQWASASGPARFCVPHAVLLQIQMQGVHGRCCLHPCKRLHTVVPQFLATEIGDTVCVGRTPPPPRGGRRYVP